MNIQIVNCHQITVKGLELYLRKITSLKKIKTNNTKLFVENDFNNFILNESKIVELTLITNEDLNNKQTDVAKIKNFYYPQNKIMINWINS